MQIATVYQNHVVESETLCLHTLRADCNRRAHARNGGKQSLPPHAPCRLQRVRVRTFVFVAGFASTRSVQIATERIQVHSHVVTFASTRSVQIATPCSCLSDGFLVLCLHTLRADCNLNKEREQHAAETFASTRSVQIATPPFRACARLDFFASTRSVQIATAPPLVILDVTGSLPPHAPCRLQRHRKVSLYL